MTWCRVALAPAVNHFDPACWTDPDRFDPERFGDLRREDQNHRFGWIPFGGGVHKCIGLHFGVLEVKAIDGAFNRGTPARVRFRVK